MSSAPGHPPLIGTRLATASAATLAVLVLGVVVTVSLGLLLRSQRIAGIREALPPSIEQVANSAGDDDARLGLCFAVAPHAVASGVYRPSTTTFGLFRGATLGETALPVVLSHAPSGPESHETVIDGRSLLVIDVPFGGPAGGVVRIVRALDDVQAMVARLRYLVSIAFAVIAVFVGFAIDRARRRERRFLLDLAGVMQQVTNERSGCRIEPLAGGELDIVARHFNLMARALEQTREATRTHASELERRVLERTAELERANAALRTLDVAKDTFLSNVTHELRTPLTSIVAAAEILGSHEEVDQTNRREFANIVGHESRRLLGMIEQIIDVAQLEATPVRLTKTRTDLRTLIESARRGIMDF